MAGIGVAMLDCEGTLVMRAAHHRATGQWKPESQRTTRSRAILSALNSENF